MFGAIADNDTVLFSKSNMFSASVAAPDAGSG